MKITVELPDDAQIVFVDCTTKTQKFVGKHAGKSGWTGRAYMGKAHDGLKIKYDNEKWRRKL